MLPYSLYRLEGASSDYTRRNINTIIAAILRNLYDQLRSESSMAWVVITDIGIWYGMWACITDGVTGLFWAPITSSLLVHDYPSFSSLLFS